MINLNERDFYCWLAGFYEGEGSCGYYKNMRNGKGKFLLSISQKERQILDFIKDKVGYGSVSCSKHGVFECHRYEISMLRAIDFLSKIMPFMLVDKKIEQAMNGIESYMKRDIRPRRKYILKSNVAIKRTRDKNGRFIKENKVI